MDDDDTSDKTVILTLPTTYDDTVYTLTVTGLENIDGVMMDDDEDITDTFVGSDSEDADEVSLKGAKAVNMYFANIFFNMDVEDIDGLLVDEDIDNHALQTNALVLVADDGTTTDMASLDYYVDLSDDSDKILEVALDKDGSNDFDLDDYTLELGTSVSDEMDIDDGEKAFIGSDEDPEDLEIKGVKSINSSTIEVIFNQDVNYTSASFAQLIEDKNDDNTTDSSASIALTNAKQSSVSDARWRFSLDAEMDDQTYFFDVTDVTFAKTHASDVTTSDLETDEDALVKFSGDDTTEDYMDEVKVQNVDKKKFKVYYPEVMDEASVETTSSYTFSR
jgi:hypothetical protein